MEQLTQNADVVVIRSPAVSSGGDAVMWMSVSDAVVLVVRAGACKPIMAERASQVARSLDVPVLGTVKFVTALFFDLGVYLIVVGLVLDVLRSLGARIDVEMSQQRAAVSTA